MTQNCYTWSMTLPSQIHVFSRNGTYYFRRRIPKDLLNQYYPAKQIIFSLRTKDRREADKLARIKSVQLDQEFQHKRDTFEHAKNVLLPYPQKEITENDIESICKLWVSDVLEVDEEHRMEGISDEEFQFFNKNLKNSSEEERYNFARGYTKHIEADMLGFCVEKGYIISKNSPIYKKLAYKFLQAEVETIQKRLARDRGEIIETSKISTSNTQHNNLTLYQVFSKWKLEAKPKHKTTAEWELVINRFNELHGTLSLYRITKAHIVAFKDNRLMVGNASATVTKQLGALSSLLQYSVDNDFIKTNVAAGVKVAKSKVEKKSRLPYQIKDLNKIFSCPIYTDNHRPLGGGKEASYWLPLLALYTGARLEELGQLQKDDIQQLNKIWYIRISDEAEGTSLKTYSSRRNMPIHPKLLKLGFLEYIKQQQDKIFPALKPDSHKSLTGNFSKWWGRYARDTIGITDKRKVFHSFRHTFKDACRNSGIHQEIHDTFTGHTGNNVGSAYGTGASLKQLARQIKELKYEGLIIG